MTCRPHGPSWLAFLGLAAWQTLAEEVTTVAVDLVHSIEPYEELHLTSYLTSGCKFWGTEVEYRCVNGVSREAEDTIPQLLTMRVDCRGTHGDFQNLTLYETGQLCGRLSYRKYGNSSIHPTQPWLPLIYNHILTMEREEVVDIQCLLLPFHLGLRESDSSQQKDGSMTQKWWGTVMSLILDGDLGFSHNIYPYEFLLKYSPNTLESCESALTNGYKWNMFLTESVNNSHLVRFASPKLNIPTILPTLDLGFEMGDIFRVDKDFLHISVLEVLGIDDEQYDKKLVTLDETFYSENVTPDGFAVEVKLDVNVAALRNHVFFLNVSMGFDSKTRHGSKGVFWIRLPVEAESSPMNLLLCGFLVLFILLILMAALCYVYREDLFRAETFHFRTDDPSIELQRRQTRPG